MVRFSSLIPAIQHMFRSFDGNKNVLQSPQKKSTAQVTPQPQPQQLQSTVQPPPPIKIPVVKSAENK